MYQTMFDLGVTEDYEQRSGEEVVGYPDQTLEECHGCHSDDGEWHQVDPVQRT